MKNTKLSYISLFSNAGIGCYAFRDSFECIATNELLNKRLTIQKYNQKCSSEDAYIQGDITTKEVKDKIFSQINKSKKKGLINDVDVVIATPPCQGMSVINHKKNDHDKTRNSLVVEALDLIKMINPKFFVIENVRSFLKSVCIDKENKIDTIDNTITRYLAEKYNILSKVINFKNHGCPSSRTRTLIIGVRRDLKDILPIHIFPSNEDEKSLKDTIGHLKRLKTMGEIDTRDIYHRFKPYSPHMVSWISNLKEGESAFDNTNIQDRPHRIINDKYTPNANKNSDKYKKQYWNKPSPCVHTRNDILSSQNTIHPEDDRVFSVRELMLMMSIPPSFKWSAESEVNLNKLSLAEKELYLQKEEGLIRQTIGEAVPTIIFKKIAANISNYLKSPVVTKKYITETISNYNLTDKKNLISFIRENPEKLTYTKLIKISEYANSKRLQTAAFLTPIEKCIDIIDKLPNIKTNHIKILEPSVGLGSFLTPIISKYMHIKDVTIDAIDINEESLEILKELLKTIYVPKHIQINLKPQDFLLYETKTKYDICVGNPPYLKLTNNKPLLCTYKQNKFNKKTNNLFSFFLEQSLKQSEYVSLLIPKSTLNSPEFNDTRKFLKKFEILSILDFGEKAFDGVKIETINILIKNKEIDTNTVYVKSYKLNKEILQEKNYIMDDNLPYWIIYRDDFFDKVLNSLKTNIFSVFRDRAITKSMETTEEGIPMLKSNNIGNAELINLDTCSKVKPAIAKKLTCFKYINTTNAILIPNLTYNPRAAFLPKNYLCNGSVAILKLKENLKELKLDITDLKYFNSKEFIDFYKIARNYSIRSLNIDSNSVFFFGKKHNVNYIEAKDFDAS